MKRILVLIPQYLLSHINHQLMEVRDEHQWKGISSPFLGPTFHGHSGCCIRHNNGENPAKLFPHGSLWYANGTRMNDPTSKFHLFSQSTYRFDLALIMLFVHHKMHIHIKSTVNLWNGKSNDTLPSYSTMERFISKKSLIKPFEALLSSSSLTTTDVRRSYCAMSAAIFCQKISLSSTFVQASTLRYIYI